MFPKRSSPYFRKIFGAITIPAKNQISIVFVFVGGKSYQIIPHQNLRPTTHQPSTVAAFWAQRWQRSDTSWSPHPGSEPKL